MCPASPRGKGAFIDSLYQGYPVGYQVAWRNPSVRLKDGTTSSGKRILIDGQQRVTAPRQDHKATFARFGLHRIYRPFFREQNLWAV